MKHNSTFKILLFSVLSAAFTLSLNGQTYPFELPKLPYAYNALEPAVDAQTMEIHYSKHHAAYLSNLNKAVKGTDYEKYTLEELMLYAGENGDAIRNNAGGFFNHSLFWNCLSVDKPFDAESEVGKAVLATFGSLDSLKHMLGKAGATRFGSGWAWLYVTTGRKLAVCSTPNQDNPIMDVAAERGVPVLAIDVWEHAYYLKYQNRRGDYLSAILGIINWETVNRNYREALTGPLMKTIELETWTALNEFHEVMAATFHPSEKGDLGPIRQRSGEMLEKAKALQSGKIPQSFDTPEIRKAIGDLVNGAAALNKLVASKGSDKAITAKLAGLHDVFHTIAGMCRH